MQPFWYLLTVEGDDLMTGIASGIYQIGVAGGTVGGIGERDSAGRLPPSRRTRESVTWQGDTLVIQSEEWMEREGGKRESYQQHKEVWALDGQGRLVITVTDTSGKAQTRTVTYMKESERR